MEAEIDIRFGKGLFGKVWRRAEGQYNMKQHLNRAE